MCSLLLCVISLPCRSRLSCCSLVILLPRSLSVCFTLGKPYSQCELRDDLPPGDIFAFLESCAPQAELRVPSAIAERVEVEPEMGKRKGVLSCLSVRRWRLCASQCNVFHLASATFRLRAIHANNLDGLRYSPNDVSCTVGLQSFRSCSHLLLQVFLAIDTTAPERARLHQMESQQKELAAELKLAELNNKAK